MRSTLVFIASMGMSCATLAADPFSTLNPAHHAGDRAAYIDLSVFLGSDVAPVQSLLDGDEWVNKYDPRKGKNIALATGRLESGVVYNGWRIGHVIRQEWQATANRASLDVYRSIETNSSIPSGQQRLSYDLDGWSAQGIQFGTARRYPMGSSNWSLDLGLSISLLEGKRIRRENWSGELNQINNSATLVSASVTREMDKMRKDILQGKVAPLDEPNGRGHAVDIGGSIGREDGLRLDWAISDIHARLKWKNVPSELFEHGQQS